MTDDWTARACRAAVESQTGTRTVRETILEIDEHGTVTELHPNREAALREFEAWLENYRTTYAWYIEHPDTQSPQFVERTKALVTALDAALAEFRRRFALGPKE